MRWLKLKNIVHENDSSISSVIFIVLHMIKDDGDDTDYVRIIVMNVCMRCVVPGQ